MPSKGLDPVVLKFRTRLANRTFRHGNWRQTFVDCGGMCIKCYNYNSGSLELHEPFGEDHFGWGMMQSRILLCAVCHNEEHMGGFQDVNTKASQLAIDVDIEIELYGGYDNWIKRFGLIDRFAWIINQKGD